MSHQRFRRTLLARVAPVLVMAGAAGVLLVDALEGELFVGLWSLAVSAILVAAAAGAVMAFGDEVIVDEHGVRLGNRILGSCRRVAWTDIREVRAAHQGARRQSQALFLVLVSGRRVVLDSLQDMERLRELLRQGTAGAAGESL